MGDEIQATLPLLLQLLFIVAFGALLVGSFLAVIKFFMKNSVIIIIFGIIIYLLSQNGVL
tara:strand:+ start:44 stop:223 length:180 start_codon:yes stop_codon:yes gene_type:complete